MASAAAITFLFSFTSFGVVRILGGPGRSTLEVEIYRQTADLLDLPVASVLALLQLTAVAAMLVVQDRLERRRSTVAQTLQPADRRRRPRRAGERLWLAANLGLPGRAFSGAPLATLVGAFLPRRATAATAWPPGERWGPSAIGDGSVRVAARGGGQLVALRGASPRWWRSAWAGWRRSPSPARPDGWPVSLDAVLLLPLGTSAVTVGFGFLIALDHPVDLRAEPGPGAAGPGGGGPARSWCAR